MSSALALQPDRRALIAPLSVETSRPSDQSWLKVVVQRLQETLDDNGLTHARELAEKFRESASVLASLAAAELIAGNRENAVEASRQAITSSLEATDTAAVLQAAWTLTASGLVEEADSTLRRLASRLVGPGSEHLVQAADALRAQVLVARDDADGMLELLGSQERNPRTAGLIGWALIRLGRFDAAIQALRRDLNAYGPRPDVLTNLGYAHAANGQLKKAIALTGEALHLAPADLSIAFNLVSYQMAAGDPAKALQTLQAVRAYFPDSAKVTCALADVLAYMDKPDEALRELRRNKDVLQGASAYDRAALIANEAYLLFRLRRRSAEVTIEALRKELLRSDYANLGVAKLLARVMLGVASPSEFGVLAKGLLQRFSRQECLEFLCVAEFANDRWDEATQLSLEWARAEPFNVDALAMATYLLTDHVGDLDRAIDLGQAALKRMPAATMVANNVAYALALAGRAAEASRVIHGQPENPWSCATQGLIALRSGDRKRADALYDRAAKLARDGYGPVLELMVRVHQAIAIARIDGSVLPSDALQSLESLPEVASSVAVDPRLRLVARKAAEFGVTLRLRAPVNLRGDQTKTQP